MMGLCIHVCAIVRSIETRWSDRPQAICVQPVLYTGAKHSPSTVYRFIVTVILLLCTSKHGGNP